MRCLLGLFGGLILLVGVALLGLMGLALAFGYAPDEPVGQLWFAVHAGSLNGLQVVLERYLWPPLWQSGVLPFIELPAPLAALACVVAGALLLTLRALARPRRHP